MEKRKFVFDTSSLSHAFEDFTHAIGSALSYCLKKRIEASVCDVSRFVKTRAKSTRTTRELIMSCTKDVCMAPTAIVDELMKSPQMRDEIELLFYGRDTELRRRYGITARGFNLPKLSDIPVPRSAIEKVREVARKKGYSISEQDMSAIALAMLNGATLVTADKKMCELARVLNVDVIYTVE